MFGSRDELLEILRDVALEEEREELSEYEPGEALLFLRRLLGEGEDNR